MKLREKKMREKNQSKNQSISHLLYNISAIISVGNKTVHSVGNIEKTYLVWGLVLQRLVLIS